MSQPISLTGMVIRSAPVGEYDRRVVLLTKERGKITAFARGARRQNSTLLAAVSPFSFGTFSLYEGRDSYTMGQADIKNYFEPLKEDLEGTYYGFYFMELADYYGRENLDASMMLNLMYVTLLALQNPHLDNRLVRCIYEIRLMVINGEYPQDIALDERLSETARYTIGYVISAPLQKLYTFTVIGEVLKELERVQNRVRGRVIDTRMKSLEVLEMILK